MDNPKTLPTSRPTQTKKSKSKLPVINILSLVKNIFASTQNVVGLDIGYSYIKIVQLQKAMGGYLITNCITRALPQAAKDDPAQKRNLAIEFVKEFVADSRIRTNLCRLAISGKGIFILSLVVPSINKKDLKGVVSIELKKRLPFQVNLDTVAFDFFVTDELRDEKEGKSLQVTCIAADRISLDEHVQFVKEMGLRPIAINVIPDTLGNLLPLCLEIKPGESITLLELGANSSWLNFYKGCELVFSREIPLGGEHFTQAMAKTVTTSTGTVNIIAEEAEKIKRQSGIPLEEEAKLEYLTDFGILFGQQISTLLRPVLERLVSELVRTFSYYTKTFKTNEMETLYITGGASRMRNIDKFLLFNLPMVKSVERLNILKAVKGWSEKGVLKQELAVEQAAPHLAVAFSLCLSNGGKVNLLPIKEKLEQKAIFLSALVKISFPLILVLHISYYALVYSNAHKYKGLIRKSEAQINQLEPVAAKARDYLAIKAKLEQRKELLQKAEGKQPLWWGVLKELSNITPEEAVLYKIIVTENQEQREIRLVGKIFAKYTIVDLALSQYVTTLEDSPYFTSVEYSSKPDMYSPIPAANFEIVCKLVY